MAIRARLAIEGLREAVERVDEVGQRTRRPEPALRAAGTLRDLQEAERRRFARGRFKPITPEWVAEKRRRGLDTRVMRATGRLESALVNANRGEGIRFDVFNAELRFGIRSGRSNVYYAQAQAKAGRRVVVIDKPARRAIATRVEQFIAHGFIG